jgi:hypothetical protein
MKQDSNHIDELLRQRLHDATAPPPAFVWPRVEAELRKRRRRLLFFWLFGAGLATAGLFGWWMSATNRQHLSPVSSTSAVVQSTEKTAPIPQPATAARAAEKNTPSGEPVSAGKTTGKSPQRESVQHEAGSFSPKMPARRGELGGQPISKIIANTALPATNAAPGSSFSTSTENEKDLTSVKTPLFTLPPAALLPLSSRYSRLATANTPLHFRTPSAHINIIRNKKETRSCYDFSQHPNVLLVDVYAGPSLTQKELLTAPDNQPYLAQRRNTDSRDWSFSAGLRASLLLDRHFLVRSGFHYDQVNEVFEYIDPNSVEVTIRQTTQIVNGQTVTVIDTLGVEYGEHYLKSYNRFGMLDIPLEAGVELRNGRNGVSLNGGISLNLLFWKRGAILSPVDGRPAYFTPNKGTVDVFRANAGLSAMGSIQWFCHLRPRLRIFAEPYARIVLRPVNLPGHPVEQRYSMLGLNIGMTRIFD